MTQMLLIGLGAGLSSGLLVASFAPGSFMGLVLFCLAPLPLILAGLGWGWLSAAAGAVAGSVIAAALISAEAGVLYAATCGAPVAWLTQLVLLSRPADDGNVEWYPPGRLLTRAALLASAFGVATVVLFGPGEEAFRANVTTPFAEWLLPGLEHEFENPDQAAKFARFAAEVALPAGTVSAWLLVMVVNLWVGGRVMRLSKRLARPWPELGKAVIPRQYAAVLGGAVVASLMPGSLGIMGFTVAQVWITAYLLAGLAVIHAATVGIQGRGAMLTVLYLVMVFVSIVALVIVLIGVLEPFLNIRARILRRRNTGPGPD